jgi:glycosyltransferase involved in cell wall biosynthesis
MILLYHKVAPEVHNKWWVSCNDFYRQMCEISHLEVVTLDEYEPTNPHQVVITFDGVYQNVLKYAAPILEKFSHPYELFLTSDYIGKDNSFDSGEDVSAVFTTKAELKQLVEMGGRLQWHTRSHPKLDAIPTDQLQTELTIPKNIKQLDPNGFTWVAYPHGSFSDEVLAAVEDQYQGGLSVVQGNDHNIYKLNRKTVMSSDSFKKASIGVIIPCYNYGHFLTDAVESVLRQTRPVDKILISDDASTDDTQAVAEMFVAEHPDLIEYRRNEENLGMVPRFVLTVAEMDTDYICLLGADNRFRSDYIETTAAVLDANSQVGVAYTDFVFFGPEAYEHFQYVPESRRGDIINEELYEVRFPEFKDETLKSLKKANFIHGSSLYRKHIFEEIGGYKDLTEVAEDHNFFYRMIKAGWNAKRVPEILLEYRQHSPTQTNTMKQVESQLSFYKRRNIALQKELNQIYNSKFWKLLAIYKKPQVMIPQYSYKITHKIIKKLLNFLN